MTMCLVDLKGWKEREGAEDPGAGGIRAHGRLERQVGGGVAEPVPCGWRLPGASLSLGSSTALFLFLQLQPSTT